MKIALPVEEKSLNTPICVSFGRTPLFVMFDTENGEYEFIYNSAASSQGGAGIKAAQTVIDSQAGALLTPRCGENAAEVFNAANVKIYKTINDSIKDNIAAFEDGKLSLLDEIHAGLHGHGGE